jgi:hypothetical protein
MLIPSENVIYGEYGEDPLSASSPRGKKMLGLWRDAARDLGRHIRPHQLNLLLTCDCADLETAKLVVAPLVEETFQKPLATCSIRLGPRPDFTLRRLCEDVAFQLCQRKQSQWRRPSSPFPFHSLPLEVRLLILEYTDLVVPSLEVIVQAGEPRYIFPTTYPCPYDPDEDMSERCLTPQHRAYWQSTHCWCQFTSCRWRGGYNRDDFCSVQYAAYCDGERCCRCWEPPLPLFLVSHAFSKDAQLTFFSKNRFVILDSTVSPNNPAPHSRHVAGPRYAASMFLTEMVPRNGLGHLRFLDLIFNTFDHHSPNSAFDDWVETIKSTSDRLNLAGLTVRVYIRDVFLDRDTRGNQAAQSFVDATSWMVMPLKGWAEKGLGQLFLYFPNPWDWNHEDLKYCWASNRWEANWLTKKDYGEAVEQAIMGPKYESVALGKKMSKKPNWLFVDEESSDAVR